MKRRLVHTASPLCVLLAAVTLLVGAPALGAGKGRGGGASGGAKKAAPAAAPAPASRKGPTEIHLKGAESTPEAATTTGSAPPPSRGPTRIDFDDRLIQGQTNKSGAVYLYDRKELKTRSMVKKRESFRDEIVGSVYDGQ
jgi:hypothetical protein